MTLHTPRRLSTEAILQICEYASELTPPGFVGFGVGYGEMELIPIIDG
jgi:hypothetical protein